jgi:nicotinamidase-related amidase
MDARPPARPRSRIGAAPDALTRSATVLLLVDFINPLQFDGAEDIAAAALAAAKMTLRLKRRLAARGVPAIYANDNYGLWRSDFREVLARCRALGGAAGEMARLLAPGPRDLTILKPRHSAFYATPLELLLGQIRAKRLVLAGLAADICVQVTASDAFLRGYNVWAPADCTAAESAPRRDAALDWMRRTLDCDTRAAAATLPAARRLPQRQRG